MVIELDWFLYVLVAVSLASTIFTMRMVFYTAKHAMDEKAPIGKFSLVEKIMFDAYRSAVVLCAGIGLAGVVAILDPVVTAGHRLTALWWTVAMLAWIFFVGSRVKDRLGTHPMRRSDRR